MPDQHPQKTQSQGQALDALMNLPGYEHRGCAPASQGPARSLWLTPESEQQAERHQRLRAAKAICAGCPVREACAEYAIAWEAWNIWGGMTPPERRRVRARRIAAARTATAAGKRGAALTAQQSAVLTALLAHDTLPAIAAAAALDVRTTAWQCARLVTLLRLDPLTATRVDVLHAARSAGLLDPRVPIAPAPPGPVMPIRQLPAAPGPGTPRGPLEAAA